MEMVLVVVVVEGLDARAPESESSEHFQMFDKAQWAVDAFDQNHSVLMLVT